MDTKIKEHILVSYPKEACGLILQDGSVIPLENIADEPEKSFKINPRELSPYLGRIQYIYHSHCRDIKQPEVFDLRTPSFSDILGQQKTGVPWLIFGTEGFGVTEPLQIPRIKNNNYLQRPFIWYINDCYSLVQDYYQFEFGIFLENHKAKEDYKDIRKLNNIFGEYIREYGFIEFPVKGHVFQKGDLVLLDSHGFEKNHLGIYEDGYILHQDTLSKKEKIEHFVDRIHLVLRHESKSI